MTFTEIKAILDRWLVLTVPDQVRQRIADDIYALYQKQTGAQ